MFGNIIDNDLNEIYERDYSWDKLKKSNILITGAYGMLASYLVYFFIFLNEKYNYGIGLYCQGRTKKKMYDRFGRYVNKEYFHDIYNDLDSEFNVDVSLNYIIHAASIANPLYYSTNPVEVEEPNVIGTYYLLKLCEQMKVEKFLFFSSGDVYGKMEKGTENITEDMYGAVNQWDYHSCYGESKRMGETWCESFYREKNVQTVVARIGHTYGPTMDLENDSRVFATFVKNVIKNENIVMLSDGTSRRPFCYIADATAAFLLLLLDGKAGEAYNVCNDTEFISIGELADTLVEIMNDDVKVIRKYRNATDTYVEASFNKSNKPVSDKIRRIGWECSYNIREGFGRVIKHFNDERWGLYEKN